MKNFFENLKKEYADFKELNKWENFHIKVLWHPFALKVTYPLIIILFIIFILLTSGTTEVNREEKANRTGCEYFWEQCKDNTEFMNVNQSILTRIQVDCKFEANDLAKFGTPEWPWVPFGSYYNDDSIKNDATITLVESDVKFSNGFGAMVKSEVYCTYDLKNDEIIYLDIR